MFVPLGRLVLRAHVAIVLAWIILAVASLTVVPSLASVTSSHEAGFLPAGSPARQAAERLAAAFPEEQTVALVIVILLIIYRAPVAAMVPLVRGRAPG
jgi:uncharacterized membrane protein YdfJ with MMPL/SSD domain